MAIGNVNFADLARRMDPTGNMLAVAELMAQQNPLVADMVWREGSLTTGDRFGRRTGLPPVSPRAFNQGVDAGKSKIDPVLEPAGNFGGISKMDAREVGLGGNALALRLQEDQGFMGAFQNVVERHLFYGSKADDPRVFDGFFARAPLSALSSRQVIDCTTDDSTAAENKTSILIVGWGDMTAYGFVPKGMPAGLDQKDMGEQLVRDEAGLEYRAFVKDWNWSLGLSVRDYEFTVRLANIELSKLNGNSSWLWEKLIRGVNRMKSLTNCKPIIYMHRDTLAELEVQAFYSVKNATLSYENIGGKPSPMFRGCPIRITDGLLTTEDVVA